MVLNMVYRSDLVRYIYNLRAPFMKVPESIQARTAGGARNMTRLVSGTEQLCCAVKFISPLKKRE